MGGWVDGWMGGWVDRADDQHVYAWYKSALVQVCKSVYICTCVYVLVRDDPRAIDTHQREERLQKCEPVPEARLRASLVLG